MKKKDIGIKIIMWISCLIFLIPLYWLLISSVKSDSEITKAPPTFWPHEFIWSNYPEVWDKLNFVQIFSNSIFVSVTVTILTVLFCTMAAYSLSKKKILGKNIILLGLVATMTVPPMTLLIPLYFIIMKVGLYNNLLGLILPFCVTVFGIFFMKQYIDDVPDEILESGKIDGAGEFRIFFKLLLPVIGPALATLAIITFVDNWNSFTMPLVLIQDESKYTLPLKLATISADTVATPWSKILAANVITMLPVIILFLATQKKFIQGIMDGAVKG